MGRYFGDDRVFRDIDGIEGGANFEDVLKRTAQSADAMVVLIGRDWVTLTNKTGQRRLHEPDDWVAREIAAALERKIDTARKAFSVYSVTTVKEQVRERLRSHDEDVANYITT